MTMSADRFRQAVQMIVREAVRHIPYALSYPARVLKDHGDMHLDLEPLAPYNADLPFMTRVPLVLDVPGVTIQVAEGSEVLVIFDAAEADMPRAHIFEQGALKVFKVQTIEGNSIALDDNLGTVTIEHATGSKIVMLPDGDIAVLPVGRLLLGPGALGAVLAAAHAGSPVEVTVSGFTATGVAFTGTGTGTVTGGSETVGVTP